LSFILSLYKISRTIGLGKIYETRLPWLRRYIKGSGMRIPYEGYIALITLIPLIISILAFILSYNLHLVAGTVLPPFISIILSSIISIIAYLLALTILILIPVMKFRSRGELIDIKIPILQSYLATLALSGMSSERILLRLYELRKLIGIDIEFEEIAKSLLLRGEDVTKALDRAIEITPSSRLATILAALKGLATTGTGLVDYVRMSFTESLSVLETKARMAYSSLSILIEVFISLTVLLPVVVLLVVIALFSFGGALYRPPIHPKIIVGLVSFIVVPFVSLGLLVVVDSILSKVRP